MYVLSKNIKHKKMVEFSIFTAEKNLCILIAWACFRYGLSIYFCPSELIERCFCSDAHILIVAYFNVSMITSFPDFTFYVIDLFRLTF